MAKKLTAAAIACFGVVWLLPADWLFGMAQGDLGQQWLPWREFLAERLRAGHVPLWNPWVFGGAPFLGGFQAAVFYPPNWVFAVMPLTRACNLSILLHLVWLALGMSRWARRRGLGAVAGWVGAVVLIGSGAVFPQVYAGHLSNVCSMAWTPWIFSLLEDGAWLPCAGAVAMQVLGGQVQYVFDTFVAAVLLAAVQRRGLTLISGYAFAALLAAAQLIPGWDAAQESLRHGRLPESFAAQFSLAFESLPTWLTPNFLGEGANYRGPGYAWEMNVFFGIAAMALVGFALAERANRPSVLRLLGVGAALVVLALGAHTPLFLPLYRFVPGFGLFRGWSKFDFPATVLCALVAAQGAEAIWKTSQRARQVGAIVAFTAGVGALAGIFVAGSSLIWLGLVAIAIGACLLAARWRRGALWGLLALIPFEAGHACRSFVGSFRMADIVPTEVKRTLAADPGDYRVQDYFAPNNGVFAGAPDFWGNDPAVPRRYAELLGATQGIAPDAVTQNIDFKQPSPLFALLRLKYVFLQSSLGLRTYPMPPPLPHVMLVPGFEVASGRDAALGSLLSRSFDPRREAVLESDPGIPSSLFLGPRDEAHLISSDPDRLVIEATLASPALLLVTDTYSQDWRARSLDPTSPQKLYPVLPADWALRAIPLQPGHHRLEMTYSPRGLALGITVSLLSGCCWLVGWCGLVRSRSSQPGTRDSRLPR